MDTSDLFEGMEPLDPAIRKVWRVKFAFLGSIVLLGAIVYDVSNLFDGDRTLALGLAPSIALLLFTGIVVWIPGFRYRSWAFRLTDQELLLQRGILNRVRTIVPLRRVQHLDVSQDLVEREFELGKLIVHTAGTRSSEVVLPGLRLEVAESLRDRIKAYITDDVL